MTNMAITRRGFMKAAATATAALGVAGAPVLLDEVDQAFADSIPKREAQDGEPWLYPTAAPFACTPKTVVVKIEGDPRRPAQQGRCVCLKCLSQIQTVYSPRHVLHPMKRVGDRGQNQWEAISWDEATDLAGEQIATAVEKYGPYSLLSARGGGGAYIEWETGVSTTRSEAATPWPLVPVSVLCPEISFPRRRLGSTAA